MLKEKMKENIGKKMNNLMIFVYVAIIVVLGFGIIKKIAVIIKILKRK